MCMFVYVEKSKNGRKIYVCLFIVPMCFDFKVLSEYKNILSKLFLFEK